MGRVDGGILCILLNVRCLPNQAARNGKMGMFLRIARQLTILLPVLMGIGLL